MSEERTMRVELMFPSKYLRAADFLGKTVTKIIERVESEKLKMSDGRTEKKWIVHFKDTEKMLVLNKTNAYKIAEVLEEKDAMKWPGKEITLWPTTCECFGKIVDCIRVKDGE